jgi:hypothetical protein
MGSRIHLAAIQAREGTKQVIGDKGEKMRYVYQNSC